MSLGAKKGSSQLSAALRKGGWPFSLPRSQAEQKVCDWHRPCCALLLRSDQALMDSLMILKMEIVKA